MSAGREVSFENERFLFRIFFFVGHLCSCRAVVVPLACRAWYGGRPRTW